MGWNTSEESETQPLTELIRNRILEPGNGDKNKILESEN